MVVEMKVCVDPIPNTLSRAMGRVANALKRYAPKGIEIVENPEQAEVQILHAIGSHAARRWVKSPNFIVIQYCYNSADHSWKEMWSKTKMVWSYYNLKKILPDHINFYYSPLGIDDVFINNGENFPRDIDIMTSGYVTGIRGEAIEEVAIAADKLGLTVKHLGPNKIVNQKTLKIQEPMEFKPGLNWSAVNGISDKELAKIYKRSRWVSGLRHIEGFEFPIIEGLACGARPIAFDHPEMRHWYDGHAVFIPECNGEDLVKELIKVMSHNPWFVTEEEKKVIIEKFDWAKIIKGFWNEVMK